MKTQKRINMFLKNEIHNDKLINGQLIPNVKDLILSLDHEWLCEGTRR